MKRKEALSQIRKRHEEGLSKSEIFDELLSKVQFKSDLKLYLAMVPTHEDRKKYKALNTILYYGFFGNLKEDKLGLSN